MLAAILAELPPLAHEIAAKLAQRHAAYAGGEGVAAQKFESVVALLVELRDHPQTLATLGAEIVDLTAQLHAVLTNHVSDGIKKAAAATADAPAAPA